jgi:hypothetical protein
MNNQQNTGVASHPKQIAPNAFVVGRSQIKIDRQQPADWCQIAITGDCLDVGPGCGRPRVVISTGIAVLVSARGQDMALLESLRVGWEYRLYGRLVERPGEFNGEQITKRYFTLLPSLETLV